MAITSDDPTAEASAPLITDVQRVEVVAPATLPEGYALEVNTTGPSGEVVHSNVVVPEGGVVEGQHFTAHCMEIPNDGWRDGIFGCFNHGCFHPHVILGIFCFCVPLGQVMTRMDLNWIGEYRDPEQQVRRFPIRITAFKVVMLILAIYLGGLYMTKQSLWDEFLELPLPIFLPMSWWDFLLWVYIFVVVMKTRAYIRRKYSIPESGCNGFEDCFCAFFCPQLTICQMARHTADYDTYRAVYCSENGLPANAPTIV